MIIFIWFQNEINDVIAGHLASATLAETVIDGPPQSHSELPSTGHDPRAGTSTQLTSRLLPNNRDDGSDASPPSFSQRSAGRF
jgi:hypothetical protein